MNSVGGAAREHFDRIFDRLLTAALAVDTVPDDAAEIRDIGMDSHAQLAMMMDLEDTFNEVWPAEELVSALRLSSVGQLREAARHVFRPGGP